MGHDGDGDGDGSVGWMVVAGDNTVYEIVQKKTATSS